MMSHAACRSSDPLRLGRFNAVGMKLRGRKLDLKLIEIAEEEMILGRCYSVSGKEVETSSTKAAGTPRGATERSGPSFLINPRLYVAAQVIDQFGGAMKFGKRLKQQIRETLPGWQDKYLSYKDLKKLIRLISLAPSIVNVSADSGRSEARFIFVLDNEIEKFNLFFMEQEEEFIIRDLELKERIQEVINTWGPAGTSPSEPYYVEEMGRIRRDIVDFHGEMVLLENYSIINYTGLAKILKKYDKRTGGLLRRHVIQNVLEQPFFMTDLIQRLVRECELTIDAVFPVAPVPDDGIPVGDGSVFRNTVAALQNMREIRRRSSTYSQFSLPPLDLP